MIYDNSKKKDFEKIKSPSSNNPKPRVPHAIVNNNKYDDERMLVNNQQIYNSNPFNKQVSKERESKDKEFTRNIKMSSINKKNKLDLTKLRK